MKKEDLFFSFAIVFAAVILIVLFWSSVYDHKNCEEKFIVNKTCQAALDKAISEGYGATGGGGGGFGVTKEKFPECYQLVCNQ